MRDKRFVCWWAILMAAGCGLFIVCLIAGPAPVSVKECFRILMTGKSDSAINTAIVLSHRLPETITAVTAGALLSVSGLILQTLFRNPLAGPSVLGISSGASFGVVLFSSGFISAGWFTAAGDLHTLRMITPVMALCGSMAVLFFMLFVYRLAGSLFTVLLTGIMMSFFLSALENILLNLSSASTVKQLVNWGFGNFSSTGPGQVVYFSVMGFIFLFISLMLSGRLDALQFGEEQSRMSGKNPGKTQIMAIIITACMAAWVTAYCGPIAFIGLCVPHIARPLIHSVSHYRLMVLCGLIGAGLSMACLLIMRLAWFNGMLPLNAITSFLGAPFVIYVLIRYRHNHHYA